MSAPLAPRGAPGRAQAVRLASAIGAAAGLVSVAPWVVLSPSDPIVSLGILAFFVFLSSLAATCAAWIVCGAMNRWRVRRAVGVFGLAVTTFVCGVLLLPALIAVVNVPGVWNGGPLPCINFGGECQAGFHGLDAMRALLGTTLETYGLCIYAVVVLPNATVTLLVPAFVWDAVARRQGWIRSIPREPSAASGSSRGWVVG